jgi:hypothetical protein
MNKFYFVKKFLTIFLNTTYILSNKYHEKSNSPSELFIFFHFIEIYQILQKILFID